jgi:hypothetical protein
MTSINDYWVAKMNATEASGEAAPEPAPEEVEVAVDEAAILEEDEAPVEEAEAAVEVPTSENTKAEISEFLTTTHGVDPDDLKSLTKSELLDLANDLGAGE